MELHDVAPLTQTILNSFESMAEANKVELKIEMPAQPMKCYFDELRLRQIVSNIVNNAIKYNKAGGHARIYFEENDELVKIFVEDTGPGIPADEFSKVFNEFETVGKVAQHHKGTGLGMPISRKLIEGMGGQLLLKSTVGVGSTFWVELPKNKVMDPSVYRPRPDNFGIVA